MKVRYFYQSGFMVELEKEILIFDYYKGDIPKLDHSKTIYFFASHVHADHFSFQIFSTEKFGIDRTQCRYILSNDIHKKYNQNYFMKKGISEEQYQLITFIKPHEDKMIGGLRIRTLDSTDRGVAYLVDTAEGIIYHAGDLNWWTWEGATKEYEMDMEQKFKAEMARLAGIPIEIAFMTLDGRQKERFCKGFDYFMRHTDTKRVYPMHFWQDSSMIDLLMHREESKPYRERIMVTTEMMTGSGTVNATSMM